MIDQDFIIRCHEMTKPVAEENLRKQRERVTKWRLENPEKQKQSQKICDVRRRYRKKLMKLILTPEERKAIYDFYRKCPKDHHVDHIIPISKGGNHTLDNLQYLSAKENLEKGSKWIGVKDGECYDPDFLIKRLEKELNDSREIYVCKFRNN